jgi:hypothetical protein
MSDSLFFLLIGLFCIAVTLAMVLIARKARMDESLRVQNITLKMQQNPLCPRNCDDRRMKVTKGMPEASCMAFTVPGTGLVHAPLTCLGTSDSFKCQECLDWCDGSIKVTDK